MGSRLLFGMFTAGTLMAGLLITPAQAESKPYCERYKCIALTFDDGPSPYTPKLLDTLRKHHAKATFFVVGRNVQRYPGVVRRMAAEGHEIGNHTWNHPHLPELFDEEIVDQLTKTQDVIHKTIGRRPTIMRPPFGETNERVGIHMGDLGLPQILWTGTTRDWEARDTGVITDRLLALAKRDAVILMHDTVPETVKAMPRVLKSLEKQGYRFVPFSWVLRGKKLSPGEIYPF